MHDVAVFHHVFLAFHVEFSGLTYGSFRAIVDKVVVLDDLRADKSLFEIRVDDTGTLRSLPSLWNVQARTSIFPAVKYVSRFSSL